jgi:hypothetical protein
MDGNPKQVDIKMLRETLNSVLDFIEHDLKKSAVQLPADYYWVVPDDALYAMVQPPAQLDCGSLNDDLDFVEQAHEHREQALPVMFIHLAPLLYALSKAVPSFTSPDDQSQ